MTELTPQQVDCILYNLRTWRRLLTYLEPRTSSSVVILPVSHSRGGSAVERVALSKAVISEVLDKVECALGELPVDTQRIVKMYFDERLTMREIAYRLNRRYRRRHSDARPPHSKTTVWRQVMNVRVHLSQRLGSVDPDFWRIVGQAS